MAPFGGSKSTFLDKRSSKGGEDAELEAAFDQMVVNKQRIVLPRILADQPVRLFISSDHDAGPSFGLGIKVETAYNSWFQNALTYITSSIKEDESVEGDIMVLPLNGVDRTVHKSTKKWFADITPILKRGIRVEVVNSSLLPVDLKLTLLSKKEKLHDVCQCKTCVACTFPGTMRNPPEIVLGRDWNDSILRHEIGHTFGFTDMYGTFYQTRSSPYYHSTSNSQPSIMWDSRYGELECGDADAVLIAIDLVRHEKTSRVREGWHSLCPLSKDATPDNDQRDIYKFASPTGSRTLANLFDSLKKGE